jgi:hypothetical protein
MPSTTAQIDADLVVYLGYRIVARGGRTAVDHHRGAKHVHAPGFVEVAANDQGRPGLFNKLPQGRTAHVLEKMSAIEFHVARRNVGKHDVPAGVFNLAVARLKVPGQLFFGKPVHSPMPRRRGRKSVNAYVIDNHTPPGYGHAQFHQSLIDRG